jgi:hypothetical protein
LRWRWAPVVRMAAVPKEARRGQTVRADQRPASQISGRAHSGLAQSRQMQVVHPRVPKAGKVPSQAPGKPSISSAISANTASIRPRSGSAILADQEQTVGGGVGPGLPFAGPLTASGSRTAGGCGERPPVGAKPVEQGWRQDWICRTVGQGRNRGVPTSSSVRVCGVFGAGRAPSSAARQGCHA